MMQQGISLPPQVQGPSKGGSVEITIGKIKWTSISKSRPQHLFARILWWGDASATNHDIPLYSGDHTAAASTIQFPLASSAAHIARYLNDMAALEISILQLETAPKVIAKVSIDTASIANAGLASFNEAVPVIAVKTGAVLGSLHIKLDINYRPPAVGSFSLPSSASRNTSGQGLKTVGQEVVAALESLNISTNETENGLLNSSNGPVTAPVAGTARGNDNAHVIDTPAAEPCSPASAVADKEEGAAEKEEVQDDNDDMEESRENSTEDEEQEGQYSVLVRVDSAFDLPSPAQRTLPDASNSFTATQLSSLTYVSVVWQRNRSQRVNTHLTASQEVPLAPEIATGSQRKDSSNNSHAAVWQSDLELKVDIQPFLTAATAFLGSKTTRTGILDGPLLLINVWRSGMASSDPMDLLEKLNLAPSMKETAVSSPFDQLIGCAAVDLRAFLHQKHDSRLIEGKFPLVNAQHQLQGVVKASVTPNSHLTAALNTLLGGEDGDEGGILEGISTIRITSDAIATKKDGNNNGKTVGMSNYTTRTIFQSQQGRKQEYAWSGSDSDDGDAIAMVGVNFEGAVSCSDHEDDDFEDDYLNFERKERQDQMDVEGEAKVTRLITQDWMFDICKKTGDLPRQGGGMGREDEEDAGNAISGGGCGGGGSGDGANFCFYQEQGEEDYAVKEKKSVVFKNRLLPGVVINTRQVNYVNASDFGGSSSGGGGGSDGISLHQGVLPVVPQEPRPSAPPLQHISHHHSGLNGDWIFGIQQQQQGSVESQQQQHDEEQPSRRRPPPEVTANQFAPMTNLPK